MAACMRRGRQTAAIVGGALVLFGVANLGLAHAAEDAVPGDALYGLDRTYERVADLFTGIKDRTAERLEEARALVSERGRVSDGLAHAAAALSQIEMTGLDAAVEALSRAASETEALESVEGQRITQALRAEAAELLTIATRVAAAATGGEDPSEVAEEFAKQAHLVAGEARALRPPEPATGFKDGGSAAEDERKGPDIGQADEHGVDLPDAGRP